MKKLLYTLAAVLVCTGAAAQNPTLYFMEGVPLRSQMNPGWLRNGVISIFRYWAVWP